MSFIKEHFISEYLKRIGYHGDTTPCLDTLRALQVQHIHHIPFENLDLLTDAFTPNLDQEYLFDKIVTRRRGGVCYELNTSFYNLLRALGFDAHQISGAVQPGEDMYSHVATLVHLPEGDFIADVGFGDSYLPVLNIAPDVLTICDGLEYRMNYFDRNTGDIQRRRPGQDWERMYTMCLTPRRREEYFGRFRWASAMGNTVFSQYPICVSHGPVRRVTLRKGALSVEENGQITEQRPVAPGSETELVLRNYFDLP